MGKSHQVSKYSAAVTALLSALQQQQVLQLLRERYNWEPEPDRLAVL